MIKESELGNTYTVKYNMMVHTVTITEDPSKYKFYKTLGLDVFEEIKVEYKPKRRGKNKKQVKEEE